MIVWKLSKTAGPHKITVIAHRGAAGLAPENTLAAIDSGLKYRTDFIEIDIRQTLDRQIVVIHDKSIDRTSNGKGLIHQMNYSEIEKYNASVSFKSYAPFTKIPLLSDVLRKIKRSNAGLLIEIKDPSLYPGMVAQFAQMIRETEMQNNIMVFSFNQNIITEVKNELPGVPTGIFVVGLEKVDDSLHANYISPNWVSLLYFPFLIQKYQRKGYKILAWTADSPFFIRYLVEKNVDGIITDRPDKLMNGLPGR